MEQTFLLQMSALSAKNSNELASIDMRSRAKVAMEENRHALLVRDTEETNKRWGEIRRFLYIYCNPYVL